ncbi:MAG: DotU family type IV/VI secretion system protein [Desulfobacteraceae bacterium]|nr:DotU family type IV/VI secretion system protein [Desulfobacteraceae bacterium]
MRLADCFTDIFAYTLFLVKSGQSRGVSFDQAMADIDRMLRESAALAQSRSIPDMDHDLARFAVAAWVDEAIMKSAWEGKRLWQRDQLQRRLYQTTEAGELFFQRLNMVGPHQNEVREVFYLCLALGFTGQYCNPGDEMLLDQLKSSNLKLITGSSVELPTLTSMPLFPEALAREESREQARDRNRFSLMFLGTLLVPLVLYGTLFALYRFILSNIGETIIGRIP